MKCKLVSAGQPRPGGHVRPGRIQPAAERAIFWTASNWKRPATAGPTWNGAGSFSANCPRNHRGKCVSSSSTARPAIPSTSTSSPKTSTTSGRWNASSPWSNSTASRAIPTFPASSPRTVEGSYPYVFQPGGDRLLALPGRTKTLINVGSVGQPRDGDWRACYVMLDGDSVAIPPGGVRHRYHHQEDLRDSESGQFPRRPAP